MKAENTEIVPDFLQSNHKGQNVVWLNRYIIEVTTNTEKIASNKPSSRKLILLSGGSGVGKDTMVNKFEAKKMLARIKTCTTRAEVRNDEKDNDPYVRLTSKEFELGLNNGEFLESNFYAESDSYGTRRKEIIEVMKNGSGVLRMDPNGARAIMKAKEDGDEILENVDVIYFFIIPPSMESLHQRLINRYKGQYDEETAVKKAKGRLEASVKDMKAAFEAHYIVVNHDGEFEETFIAVSDLLFNK